MATHPPVPGEPTPTITSLLESAASVAQVFAPIRKIHPNHCAFHFYSNDMTQRVEAHQNEEMRQCLIYDDPEVDAKLIGLEYIMSENLFMPEVEKPLWHSHEFEVKSGVLFMPSMPGTVEGQDLEEVCKTYGKTIHFRQVDRGDNLSLGIPHIMMALTRDGQVG